METTIFVLFQDLFNYDKKNDRSVDTWLVYRMEKEQTTTLRLRMAQPQIENTEQQHEYRSTHVCPIHLLGSKRFVFEYVSLDI